MSIISDLKDADELLKGIAISLLLMPLWYLSIYFINPELFEKTDIIFKIVFCGVNSIFSSMLLTIILFSYFSQPKDRFIDLAVISIAILFIYKCTYLFSFYSILFYLDAEIYYYSYVTAFYIFHLLVIALVIVEKKSEKKKMRGKQ